MKLTIDPVPLVCDKPQYFSFINKGISQLISEQNNDGYWGEKNITNFKKIYYTTQVIQCLLKAGFSIKDDVIQDALDYLDNFKEVRIENRANFFLHLPLGLIEEAKLKEYLKLLKKKQKHDGSFIYEIRDLDSKEQIVDGWPSVRRGSYIFYTLHALHFLSMIDEKKYQSLASLKKDIWNDAFQMIRKELQKGVPLNTLKDPMTGYGDPELTAYAIALLNKIGENIPNFSEVINWLLNKQVEGSWMNNVKATSLILIDLASISYDQALSDQVKIAIGNAMKWLINHREEWEVNANLKALAINALIFGNYFITPDFYQSFYVNYMKELRSEVRKKKMEIGRIKKSSTIRTVVFFLLGVGIQLIVDNLIIPFVGSFI